MNIILLLFYYQLQCPCSTIGSGIFQVPGLLCFNQKKKKEHGSRVSKTSMSAGIQSVMRFAGS
jgi:hypothetical protein